MWEKPVCLHNFSWRQTTCGTNTNNRDIQPSRLMMQKKANNLPRKGKNPKRIRVQLDTNLAPTDTRTTLSRLSLHHSSTSCAKVALNKALLTTWDVHARKMEASWSRNPDFPSSNSLSDSSTTSHSTLGTERFPFQQVTCGEGRSSNRPSQTQGLRTHPLFSGKSSKARFDKDSQYLVKSIAGGSCFSK